jgi:glycosyltransferase involved in cell wall biosynthesis
MRIGYICADIGVPVFGRKGCSVHVQELIRAFRNCGAEVELFAARLGGEPPADLRDVVVHALPAIPPGDPRERERAALNANRQLRVLIQRADPFDLIYERYSLWSFAALGLARSTGVGSVLEVNSPLIDEQAARHRPLSRRVAERVAWRAFSTADLLIAVSQEVANYLDRTGVDSSRVHVVPNGVDVDRFRVASPPDCTSQARPITIGFVGSLKPWHGLSVMVDAFAAFHSRIPNSQLLIVGDGPERATLEVNLAMHGLTAAARLCGAVSPDQVPDLLSKMDVAVAPYPQLPNFYFSPLKVFEYMAAGRAVVASRIGQIEQLITDGESGLLVLPGDSAALASALEYLALRPELRARLGQAARASVSQRHSWKSAAARILIHAGFAGELCTAPLVAGV